MAQIVKAVYAFDVDDTLALQGAPFPGPVILNDIARLRSERIVTGICGNFQVLFKFFPDWYQYFSFYGPTQLDAHLGMVAHHQYKHLQMIGITKDIAALKYVMVGNKRGDPKARPGSQDDVQARLANWKFISETDFARGVRA